jgi:plasmid stabilization system protein ParE
VQRLIYRPEAVDDVQSAFDWYEKQRLGLGEEFLAELSRIEQKVLEHPTAFRVVRRDARRVLMHRFPFQVFFRVVDETAVVIACFHGRRSPKRLERRK